MKYFILNDFSFSIEKKVVKGAWFSIVFENCGGEVENGFCELYINIL